MDTGVAPVDRSEAEDITTFKFRQETCQMARETQSQQSDLEAAWCGEIRYIRGRRVRLVHRGAVLTEDLVS